MPLHCGRIGRPEAKAMPKPPRKRKLETSNNGMTEQDRVAAECIQGWARDVDAYLGEYIARCEKEIAEIDEALA